MVVCRLMVCVVMGMFVLNCCGVGVYVEFFMCMILIIDLFVRKGGIAFSSLL